MRGVGSGKWRPATELAAAADEIVPINLEISFAFLISPPEGSSLTSPKDIRRVHYTLPEKLLQNFLTVANDYLSEPTVL